ncbi:MAG: indolepyruvate ferredoxin oxidoreductase subunit alpha [Christensenellales bacterium]|jgi:indolepyruvate ferredoxin oxidoreductase alpha subunit|nr:indolepyruvate ferredoxin oxidoreductase subunit alpha [Clostridiales bacterium]
MKRLMIANEAIARGAYEAGVKVVSSYPGTPSTEITEFISKYDGIHAEWAPNEKVALEVSIGASIAGARAMSCMKHVGVNVAADPLFTASYTGVNGGLVLVVADDPAMHSSQNEQDSRFYARSAHVPMLEPADSLEAKNYVKLAFDLSEQYDTPVMIRLTTRIAHSQSLVTEEPRIEIELKEYKKDVNKFVMMPAMARGRHRVVEERERQLRSDLENNKININRVEYRDKRVGVVCAGAPYQYVKEVTNASIFKLGMVYPIPVKQIFEFAKNVDELIVIEELEPFIEDHLKANGIECSGKSITGLQGELSTGVIMEKYLGQKRVMPMGDLPSRPPVMCAGCPHRSVFYALNRLKCTVTGDIGCYSLGANYPLNAVDVVLCMGASIGMAHGFDKAKSEKSKNLVAVIGDSTFVHSGITGIINAVYNNGSSTTIILDNSTTGMTGHQENPTTGKNIKGEPANKLNLELLLKACGVQHVVVVDAYDITAVQKAVKEETAKDEVSVIIARRPCALLNRQYPKPYYVAQDKCKKCKACLQIGCPAIENLENKSVRINPELCVGCGVCTQLCKFNSILQEV